MLTTGNDILAVAHEHRFAVPAFNISSYSMLRAVVDICEEKRSPHIIAIHPKYFLFLPLLLIHQALPL